MKEFTVKDLATDDEAEVVVKARSAEEAGQIVLGRTVTRHPSGGNKPVIAKAYSQREGGLTMVRLYESGNA